MKKCKICEKKDCLNLMNLQFKILIFLFLTFSSWMIVSAEQASPIEANYNCRNTNINRTVVTDSDRNGIYDTYSVYWCDGTVHSYPISAVGDIRRWPPRGIPTREISIDNINTRAFVESYYGINSSPLICQFIKFEGTDSVYFFDNFFDSKIISNVNDNQSALIGIEILPNPTQNIINISYSVKTTSWVYISVYNEIGIVVEELDNSYRHPGSYSLSKDLSILPNGAYFITTKIGYNEFITRKIIISK